MNDTIHVAELPAGGSEPPGVGPGGRAAAKMILPEFPGAGCSTLLVYDCRGGHPLRVSGTAETAGVLRQYLANAIDRAVAAEREAIAREFDGKAAADRNEWLPPASVAVVIRRRG